MNQFKILLREEKKFVDAIIRKEIGELSGIVYPVLYEVMEYALFTGGKRVRPILLKWCAELGEPDRYVLDKALCSIEYIHTYSLIHDDLPCMDDDDFRRGKPTVHRKFTEADAVLAGDALLTEAFRLLGKAGIPSLAVELALNAGAQGMVGGQVMDMKSEKLDTVNELKTAHLFRCAAVMGGIAGQLHEEALDKVRCYGINLGRAFQLRDDIMDAEYGMDAGVRAKAKKYTDAAKESAQYFRNSEKLIDLADFVIERDK